MIKGPSFLSSGKIQINEVDIEKIKNILIKIILDVKENMAEEQPSGALATAEAVKGIIAVLPDKPQSELTAADVSTAITAYIGTMITMDENASELFRQLAKQVLELPLDEENQACRCVGFLYTSCAPVDTENLFAQLQGFLRQLHPNSWILLMANPSFCVSYSPQNPPVLLPLETVCPAW